MKDFDALRRGYELGTHMISSQSWISKMQALPPKRQQEVVDFIEFLSQREARNTTETSGAGTLEGLWADLEIELDADEIEEARREMWGGFPRRDFP